MAVVALLTDVTMRLRLADAVKGTFAPPPECVARVPEARQRLAAGGARVLVVGARDADDRPTAPFVAEVRRQLPSVAVVAYLTSAAGASEDVLAFGRSGAHNLIFRGIDDERHALRTALRAAEQRCTAALVYERVRDQIAPGVAPLVALYLRADGEPPTVAQAADLLGVHRKTLVNRLAAAGCPTPRALRTWCRLFVASRLLEEPGRTVESVALQLDFETTAGLRNALKRYTGRGARAVCAAGGLDFVLAEFNMACRAQRAARVAKGGRASAPNPQAALVKVGAGDAPDGTTEDAFGGTLEAAPASASEHAPAGAAESAARRPGLPRVATHALLIGGAYYLGSGVLDGLLDGLLAMIA